MGIILNSIFKNMRPTKVENSERERRRRFNTIIAPASRAKYKRSK